MLKIKKHFQRTLNNDLFNEAIYIASPVLYDEMIKLIDDKIGNKKKIERTIYSLYRYFSRMSTRCTPFGLFAGCSIGKIRTETNIDLQDNFNRKTRLDMYYLCVLYDTIVNNIRVKDGIKYYTNTTLYPTTKKFYRYIETLLINNNRKYQISEINTSYKLSEILSLAKNGVTLKEMVEHLVDVYLTEEDILIYLNKLIDYQILVGDLSNSIIGTDYLNRIISLLYELEGMEDLYTHLNEIQSILKKLDLNNESNKIKYYREMEELIEKIKIPFQKNYLFQVDVIRKSDKITLNTSIIEELKSSIIFCNKITPLEENESLNHFKRNFIERYDEKEVPLMEVLDPEIGLGYPINNKESDPSPLIDDLILPLSTQKEKNFETFKLNRFQIHLFKKTIECISNNSKCIFLNDLDVKDYTFNWSDLPPTMYSMFKVIRSNPNDVLIKLESTGGSCGANLFSRFSHADYDIDQFVKKITAKEQELMPDVIYAELVHLPESRVGNVLLRPHSRNYELLYLSTSDNPSDFKIPISDLLLSVHNNRIVIRSKKLDKEIIPRLTTAHNYHNNTMPIYRFLCDLQVQSGRNALYFSWGPLGSLFTFLPRVQYKNTILSEASWNLESDIICHLFDLEDDNDLIQNCDIMRESINLPEHTLMPDGDNELYTNWNNPLSIRSLLSIIKKRKAVFFKEFLFEPDNAIVRNKECVYQNECIIVLYNDKNNENTPNIYSRK